MDSTTFTALVRGLQMGVATSLIFLGGLSSCLSLWVLPLTALLPPRLACAQFTQTVTWGLHYLQPSSRLLAFLLLTTVFLTSRLPRPEDAEQWKTWALALVVLIPVAPYEVYWIFPINDRVKEIGSAVSGEGDEKEAKGELQVLFRRWQKLNFGRVGLPLAAGIVGWMGVAR
ncbi:hypothetical protein E8E13_007763 [Curvularia kusanoi]|uniref:DUF1772-domain-containing protein n=1 Tax=Curvularia kusanoi TaxID=90978 RepID=A0A9P4W9N5_CURKU|nr:hypothetical protein E8E13_007763 [Curvularia kusanoi]